jgi:hypothetical protein
VDGEEVHWTRRMDWAGMSVFVLALAVGVSVVVVVAVEISNPGHGGTVMVSALTTVLGAMVGAVSTYVGLYRRHPSARHRDEE